MNQRAFLLGALLNVKLIQTISLCIFFKEFALVKFLTSAIVCMDTLGQECLVMLYVREIKPGETKRLP